MPDQSESALCSAGLAPLLGVGAWDSRLLCDSFPVQARHRNRPFVVGGVGGMQFRKLDVITKELREWVLGGCHWITVNNTRLKNV